MGQVKLFCPIPGSAQPSPHLRHDCLSIWNQCGSCQTLLSQRTRGPVQVQSYPRRPPRYGLMLPGKVTKLSLMTRLVCLSVRSQCESSQSSVPPRVQSKLILLPTAINMAHMLPGKVFKPPLMPRRLVCLSV